MPFKDRKNPDRYEHGGADSDDEQVEMTKVNRSNKVRPALGGKGIGLRDSELDRLKGLSKQDQQRKMNALAHEFSFFGKKKGDKVEAKVTDE